MWERLRIKTPSRKALVDITAEVGDIVERSRVREGIAQVYCPHTTAGLTINENADPSVRHDLLSVMERLVPVLREFRHLEGNSDAHAQASIMGFNLSVPVEDGRLALGTWQGIYLCEFDGPRTRTVMVRVF